MFTVTLSVSEPAVLVQVMVYVLDEVRLPVDSEPDNGFCPDQALEAVQASA